MTHLEQTACNSQAFPFVPEKKDSLHDLLMKYKFIHDRIKDELTELECLKIAISSKVKENEANASFENIVASYKATYIRVSWDGKKLEGYMVDHPELSLFKKETKVKASVSIKVY